MHHRDLTAMTACPGIGTAVSELSFSPHYEWRFLDRQQAKQGFTQEQRLATSKALIRGGFRVLFSRPIGFN